MTTATTQEFPAELDPLTIESSNLMIEAKWLLAMGQPFDAAVAYVDAGRRLDLIGQRFSEENRSADAVQEYLYAAECYVEAGDHRPAEASLNRITGDERLNEQLSVNPYYAKEHARLLKAANERRRQFEKATRQSWEEIKGDMSRLDRLTERWLHETLEELPGVAEIHWIAAERHWTKGLSSKTGGRALMRRAIDHYRYCVRLHPSVAYYHLVLMARLFTLSRKIDEKLWDQAIEAAKSAVDALPKNPSIAAMAGNVFLIRFLSVHHAKALLMEAITYLERAINSPQPMKERERMNARCSLAMGLYQLGREDEAEAILAEVSRANSDGSSGLARLMLSLRKNKRAQFVSTNAPLLFDHVDDYSAREGTMLAYAG